MRYQTIETILINLLDFSVRFGGGGSFSGGSSGGGGYSGGGGSDGGDLVFGLIRLLGYLIFNQPIIGIPLTIFVVYILYQISKITNQHRLGRYISKVAQKQKLNEKNMALDSLTRKDPHFNENVFLQRTQNLFKQAQKAWGQKNLKGIQNCLSSSVYERLNLQLEINKQNKCVNNILKTSIAHAQIVGVHSDAVFDIIHVQFNATVFEEYVNTETQKQIKRNQSPFTEYWSFIRRTDCQSLQNAKGLIEGFCPNCGALTPLNDRMDCQSCGAILRSGKYDWVLAEISQSSFFNDRNAHRIPGIHDYKKTDPGFNTQHLEDLTSLIFTRYLASYYFSNQDFLVKHTTKELHQELSPDFIKDANGERTFYHDGAIGAVEVISLDTTASKEYDFCSVRVTWSGHKMRTQLGEFLPPQSHKSSLKNDVLVLKRKKGVSSNLDFTLVSNHCQGCGAPESHDDKDSCRYCGRVQNNGELDWILHDMHDFKLMDYQKVNLKVEKHINAYEILTGLVTLAYHDGKIDEKEKKIIVKFAKTHGLTMQDLKTIFNHVEKNIASLELEVRDQYLLYLKEFIKICIADGNVCRKEKAMIKQLLKKSNITDFDVKYHIEQERKNQYQMAKKYSK